MGHVPAGPLSEEGRGHDVSRRQHRGTGTDAAVLRQRLARLGEDVAAAFLTRHGVHVVARNVRRGRDELDLLCRHNGKLFAVEVKTRRGGYDPREAFDRRKERAVRSSARLLGISRVDLVTVRLHRRGAEIRWQPQA